MRFRTYIQKIKRLHAVSIHNIITVCASVEYVLCVFGIGMTVCRIVIRILCTTSFEHTSYYYYYALFAAVGVKSSLHNYFIMTQVDQQFAHNTRIRSNIIGDNNNNITRYYSGITFLIEYIDRRRFGRPAEPIFHYNTYVYCMYVLKFSILLYMS